MYDEKDLLRDGVILSTLDNLPDKKKQLWNRDSGFTKGLPAKDYTYPFRAFTTEHSFSIRFNATQSGQISRFNSEFILIYFHAPDELPLVNPHAVSTIISAEKHNSIKLTPKLVVRQCYYGHERHLKYYKTYTQSHCESECLADYTLDQCGCVPYFMPLFKDNATHAPIDDCNCLQTCTQLSYAIEVVEAKARRFYESYVLIGNQHPFFTKNIRTELHSLSEFFCNCGGSLGLFLGVSILSIVELLYFCTIRLYLQSKKRTADSTE
ncbi:pickpocket protein 28-like [Bradysia coprophila]|uniref:pickpocket protein 28-like n=1 Tax=Bradysia coprophila TaxID=38358 RepID=UPI00187DC97F|nr:pickpocket protein 28-like [Bradysia coprophila]